MMKQKMPSTAGSKKKYRCIVYSKGTPYNCQNCTSSRLTDANVDIETTTPKGKPMKTFLRVLRCPRCGIMYVKQGQYALYPSQFIKTGDFKEVIQTPTTTPRTSSASANRISTTKESASSKNSKKKIASTNTTKTSERKPTKKKIELDADSIMTWGKHIGESIRTIYQKDPGYFRYLAVGSEVYTISQSTINLLSKESQGNAETAPTPVAIHQNNFKIHYKFNEEHNGVELYFDSMPSEETRELLKKNGWRWGRYNKCWYNLRNEDTVRFAQDMCGASVSQPAQKVIEPKITAKPLPKTKEEKTPPVQQNEWVSGILTRIRNNDSFDELKTIYARNLVLMDHQRAGAIIAEKYNRFAFFYDTGTGKTAMTLNIIAEKQNTKHARFLIVAPKPLIKNAWLDDAEKYFPDMHILPLSANITIDDYRYYYHRWTANKPSDPVMDRFYLRTKELGLLKDKLYQMADHFIINIDQIRSKEKADQILADCGVNGLVIDESSILKNYESKSSQRMRVISKEMDYVYLLSGKPAPNSPLEYFSQMKIVDPETFNMGLDAFKERFFMQKGKYKLVLKNQFSERTVTNMVGQRSIIVRKEECLDLPETTSIKRRVELDRDTEELYAMVLNNFVTEIIAMDGQWTSTRQMGKLARIAKLREIASGFYLNENEKYYVCEDKMEALISLLEDEIGPEEPVIIWCNFQFEIEMIEKELKDRGHTVVTAYGGTKNTDETIQAFKTGVAQYMIAHPKTLKYGVTFTDCHYAVYNSLSYSYEDYYQSHDRIYRKGQEKKCFFYHLLSKDTIDELIYANINDKHMTAKVFEDLIKKSSKFGVKQVLIDQARRVRSATIDKAISSVNAG